MTCARSTPPTGPRSTTKGRGLGREFESRNATHQMKKFVRGTLNTFRDRLGIDVPDEALEKGYPPYHRPATDSDLHKYLLERRRDLGGPVPARVDRSGPLELPERELYAQLKKGSGKQEVATTMALVRLIRDLLRNQDVGQRIVPIIPDEARTFGMDSFFPQLKIYSPRGMTYDAVDRELVLSYKEDTKGQILHEGITEAGAMGSFSAAGSSHAIFGEPMIPLYIFYSLTVYNEPFVQPPMPEGLDEQLILRGLYRYQAAEGDGPLRAQIVASGSAMPMALRAARLLAEDWDVAADVWSAPGWQRLRQNALDCEEWNRLHPTEDQRVPLVTRTFAEVEGPIVAVS